MTVQLKEPWELAHDDEESNAILAKLRELAGNGLEQAYKLVSKAERVVELFQVIRRLDAQQQKAVHGVGGRGTHCEQ